MLHTVYSFTYLVSLQVLKSLYNFICTVEVYELRGNKENLIDKSILKTTQWKVYYTVMITNIHGIIKCIFFLGQVRKFVLSS